MKPSLISVCITYYKQKEFLCDAIKSVLNQSYQNFEIIIVDDGSNDSLKKLISNFNDTRIKLLSYKQNLGVSSAFNKAVQISKGEYICGLPADDMLHENSLQKRIEMMQTDKNIGVVFSDCQIINTIKTEKLSYKYQKLFNQKNYSRYYWLKYFFFNNNCLLAPGALIRKEAITKDNFCSPALLQLQDFDMWIQILINGYNIHILPEQLTYYRIHKNNLSKSTKHNNTRSIFENIKILKHYLKISIREFKQIFPENSLQDIDKDLIPFYLASLALEKDDLVRNQFAIDTLYDLLQNQQIVEKLILKHNFTPRDFSTLLASSKLYSDQYGNGTHHFKQLIKNISPWH